VGSWCCVAGTVTATLRLEKKGFAIKEAIPVWAEIRNLSTRRICSTQVSLIQVGQQAYTVKSADKESAYKKCLLIERTDLHFL